MRAGTEETEVLYTLMMIINRTGNRYVTNKKPWQLMKKSSNDNDDENDDKETKQDSETKHKC